MNLKDDKKRYTDIDGNYCDIYQMVKRENLWAVSRIQVGEAALEMLEQIKSWDIEQWKEAGTFALPLKLREKMASLEK